MSKYLDRQLDTAQLARVVSRLAPETLHQLIRQRGLDECTDIIAAATPAQLASVLDLDLWRSARPGQDEGFDTDRFGEWVELLVDAGGTVAVQTVAAMNRHLVVAGLSRYVRVFDPAVMVTTVDGEPLDLDPDAHQGPEREVGGYLVRGMTFDGWDAIVALLTALDADDPDRFHAVMQECRRLSNSAPEVDGLDELLTEPEQLLHDLALGRDERRSEQGYTTPADARAFLLTARQQPRPKMPATPAGSVHALVTPHASHVARIRALLEHVRAMDNDLFLTRSHELAFLANTLVAGCSIQSRAFTPQEASEAAVAICNLGIEHWIAAVPDTFLIDHDLVSAFQVGWSVLHQDVSMFVAKQLLAALREVRSSASDVTKGLKMLRAELRNHVKAGTPWKARHALDVIAMLDLLAWTSVLGLLDECPSIPAALTATLEGRTGAISATDFDFIATRSQLEKVSEFMARFPDIVRG
ncbi:MAG TPA: DUF6178 family protein [Vicinamibacterales bacterium]|nr:DUF6178 family protein [Vicinamibacterales bacterium]